MTTTRPATERAWQRAQHAARRWALWGAGVGALLGLVRFAPADWLASAVRRATDERVLLTDAQGSIWSGNAVLVLSGGPGSRDAAALPGRLVWRITPNWGGFKLTAIHACCLHGHLHLQLRPGLQGLRLELPPRPGGVGHWPARWLAGLGTPWNTLQLDGMLELSSPGLQVQFVEGRARMTGALELTMNGISSRLSPIEPLGSYRLSLRSDAASGEAATLTLVTTDGALRLNGTGQWTGARLRFRGEAQAAEGQGGALSSLLNLIGRRQGASSLISIG